MLKRAVQPVKPVGLTLILAILGGIALVPDAVGAITALVQRLIPTQGAVTLMALQRARHFRWQATVAICGIVASLSLAVALTVMVASFRGSVTQWLDTVLPADLYVRTAQAGAGFTNT